MPKISVIIPTYNRAHYIRFAIRSVLNQTFSDFELIIVDDGSIDNTRWIVNSFKDERIIYLPREVNKGPAAARNAGIKSSKGTLIAFLDDDDEGLPEKLECQVKVMEGNPEVGLVYAGYLKVDDKGKIINKINTTKKQCSFYDLIQQNPIMLGTVIVRRECFERVGLFDEDLYGTEDWDMWIRISKHFLFKSVNRPLTKYRVHKGMISRDNYTRPEQIIRVFDKYTKELELIPVNYRKDILARQHFLRGAYLCSNGRMSEGRSEFIKAISKKPNHIRCYVRMLTSLLGSRRYVKLRAFEYKVISSLNRFKRV